MAYTSVTTIETVGREIQRSGDVLAVLTNGAIAVGTAGGRGIFSSAVGVSAMVFGDVAATEDGIRLEGNASDVFVGRSGNVTGGRFGVWLGATDGQFSVRNEGSITGYEGGVRLAGQFLDLVNTGTISVPMGTFDLGIAAVTLASAQNGGSYLTNAGTIIADRVVFRHFAIVGGLGADVVTNTGHIVGNIDLGAGNDRYYGQEGLWTGGTIALGAGRNMAYGGRGAETFSLDQGGDRLLDDIVDGGGGIDALAIQDGAGDVRIDLRITVRQDTGVGGLTISNVETLITGGGNDQLIGNAENNNLITDFGNDTLDGWLGDDTLNGGAGNDTAVFSGSVAATVDLRLQGLAQDTGYGFDTLLGIESLMGGAGDDRLIGDDAANLLSGSGGNDILQGGLGNDTLDGGAGADTAVFSGNRSAYVVTGTGENVTVEGADGTDVVRNVRFLQFADRTEALTNAAPTTLTISSNSVRENAPLGSVVGTLSAQDADGDDITYSLAAGSPFAIVGNSLVVAKPIDFEAARQHAITLHARDDYEGVTSRTFTIAVTNAVETTPFVLRGGSRADVLQGEAGSDTIYGGAGKDVLSGGAGKDGFVFNTRPGSTNVDTIKDFVVPHDTIWLENGVFRALGSKGSLTRPQKLGTDAFVSATRAQDREDRIVYDKKSGKLFYDEDGAGSKAQVQIATLSKGLAMTASDLFVI